MNFKVGDIVIFNQDRLNDFDKNYILNRLKRHNKSLSDVQVIVGKLNNNCCLSHYGEIGHQISSYYLLPASKIPTGFNRCICGTITKNNICCDCK